MYRCRELQRSKSLALDVALVLLLRLDRSKRLGCRLELEAARRKSNSHFLEV